MAVSSTGRETDMPRAKARDHAMKIAAAVIVGSGVIFLEAQFGVGEQSG